jgi:4-diphosphocytidyl-2-C-methyl-D-erythritol kinase
LSGQGRNDLQAVTVRRYPDIAESLTWLKQRVPEGPFAPRMTGSGSCVFAEFARQEDAQALYAQLPAEMRGFVARGLDRHPLYDWTRSQ